VADLNTSPTSPDPEGPPTLGLQPEATIETSVAVVRVGRRPRAPYLQLIEGPGAPRRFTLNKPEMFIGRDEKADISLASANVSRRHVRVKIRHEEVSIHDFESRNGVFLNGIKVHSAVLRDGDIIQLADVVFEFCEE
jgi:pSer/pThr/pTyr-binding forkhead associated (FHA) protein